MITFYIEVGPSADTYQPKGGRRRWYLDCEVETCARTVTCELEALADPLGMFHMTLVTYRRDDQPLEYLMAHIRKRWQDLTGLRRQPCSSP
jgi:hypothetical protein